MASTGDAVLEHIAELPASSVAELYKVRARARRACRAYPRAQGAGDASRRAREQRAVLAPFGRPHALGSRWRGAAERVDRRGRAARAARTGAAAGDAAGLPGRARGRLAVGCQACSWCAVPLACARRARARRVARGAARPASLAFARAGGCRVRGAVMGACACADKLAAALEKMRSVHLLAQQVFARPLWPSPACPRAGSPGGRLCDLFAAACTRSGRAIGGPTQRAVAQHFPGAGCQGLDSARHFAVVSPVQPPRVATRAPAPHRFEGRGVGARVEDDARLMWPQGRGPRRDLHRRCRVSAQPAPLGSGTSLCAPNSAVCCVCRPSRALGTRCRRASVLLVWPCSWECRR